MFNQDEKKLVSIITKNKDIFPKNLHTGKSVTEQEIIKGVLDAAQKIQSKVVDIEDKIHEKFKIERSKIFIGRKTILKKVEEYISNDSTMPFVIYDEVRRLLTLISKI